MSVDVDLAHGGRWTSLRVGGREWLWHRSAPRASVRPGDAFVDAGGVEECVPTVRGHPDHGSVWSRPWSADGSVVTDEFSLSRTIRHVVDAVEVDYRLTASPGYRFVWAAHALLDVSADARLIAPPGTPTRVYGRGPATETVAWPGHVGPGSADRSGSGRLDRLGPDDGTAVGAILACSAVRVVDGKSLSFRLEAEGQPASVALWRNLRGWPEGDPYRSIGVEPMLGRVFDRAEGETAVVGESGVCEWRLTVSA
ncbi:hypothetical protein [Cryptosporangium sp. NPDC048952]|uniref:hypothetical protein n=1 Tax=Cryptosporangium sp. NPDC048952 TaxID=3363961 RepID=UPI003721DDCB